MTDLTTVTYMTYMTARFEFLKIDACLAAT